MDKLIKDMKADLLAYIFATNDAAARGDERTAMELGKLTNEHMMDILALEATIPPPRPQLN